MVIYLFLGIALAVGIYFLAQGFTRATPKQVATSLRIVALFLAVGVIAFLAISGQLRWALFALPVLLPWPASFGPAPWLFWGLLRRHR